jgi:uncharacterized repeat protein (TIGR03943 family)
VTLSYRTARLVVLLAWTALLAWLWASGEVARYLGPRTSWVVAFGAVALAVVTALYALWSDGGPDAARPLGTGETVGTLAMLAPVLLAVVMAHASLGALAASRKLASRGIDASRLEAVLASRASTVSFLELRTAERHHDYATQNDIRPGRQLTLEGFVMRASARPGDAFRLGRFYITCCVADSIPIDEAVLPAAGSPPYPKDAWLRVSGPLVRRGRGFALRAARVTRIAEPEDPYLSFRQ